MLKSIVDYLSMSFIVAQETKEGVETEKLINLFY